MGTKAKRPAEECSGVCGRAHVGRRPGSNRRGALNQHGPIQNPAGGEEPGRGGHVHRSALQAGRQVLIGQLVYFLLIVQCFLRGKKGGVVEGGGGGCMSRPETVTQIVG